MAVAKVTSWGRYPSYTQTSHTASWRGDLPNELTRLAGTYGSTLPFGNGRSYGDSCLAVTDHVLNLRPLDRFISVDWEVGIVVAESGVTIDELLRLVIPNGWFVPVTPGTKYVTLGGAVANDVHGKNHHVRGTFGRHIRRFGLTRSDRPSVICSEEENPALFTATIGGLGLTGLIEWVELKLLRIQSCMIDTTTIRFDSLAEFFALSKELDGSHEYSVAWIDCLAVGAATGRGVFTIGDHSQKGGFEINAKRKTTVPFTPPVSAVNKLTLRLFNSSYYSLHKAGRHGGLVSYEPFFYPLDRVLNWNRIYGRKGFQQYQCVIPDRCAESATRELLDAIAATGNGSFLAVLKKCGDVASPGLLSFPMPGVSLALDFPQSDSLASNLFPRLDSIVREGGGRLYPAKDAHMTGNDFRRFYPNWERVELLRDPALCSRFWNRVTSQ